jgi:hypothetical protein
MLKSRVFFLTICIRVLCLQRQETKVGGGRSIDDIDRGATVG